MKIDIMGSGLVAQALGTGFLKHGSELMLGTRNPSKLREWHGSNSGARLGRLAEAARFGELLVFAVRGTQDLGTWRARL